MRKWILSAGVAMLALALAGVALAKFTQFVVNTHFVYVDRSPTDIQSSSPCS